MNGVVWDEGNNKLTELLSFDWNSITVLTNRCIMADTTENTTSTVDTTTPKVTGIGGIFFYTDSPKDTRE